MMERAMGTLCNYYATTMGKKVVMALTGIILFLYVLVHMLGNLQFYAGPSLINEYARFLHSSRAAPLLWTARVVLLACVGLHIVAAVQLWWRNRSARPVGYSGRAYREADLAARTMIWSGPIIALFVIYHILHLTTHQVQPAQVFEDNLFATMVGGFKVPSVAAVYIVAMLLLGFHLWHALWSWLQTLGLVHPHYDRAIRFLARALTVLVVLGDISFPLSVQLGFVTFP